MKTEARSILVWASSPRLTDEPTVSECASVPSMSSVIRVVTVARDGYAGLEGWGKSEGGGGTAVRDGEYDRVCQNQSLARARERGNVRVYG